MMRWFQTGRYVAYTARQREAFGQVPTVVQAMSQLVRNYGHTASQFVR
jgi:hypothetical protein